MEIKNINDCKVIVSTPTNTNYLDLFKCSNIFCIIAMINGKVSEEEEEEMKGKEKKYLSEVFMKDIMKYVKEKEGNNSISDHFTLEEVLQKFLKNEKLHGNIFETKFAFDKLQSIYDQLKALDKKYKKPSKKYEEEIVKVTKMPIDDLQRKFSELTEKDKATLNELQKSLMSAIDQLVAEYNNKN